VINLRIAAVTSLGLLALASGAALAGPRDDVLEAMGKCAAIADDKVRLGCYDAVAPRLRDALNAPPATLDHPPTKEEQQSWFGFDLGDLFGAAPAQQTTPQKFGADQIPAPPPPPAAASGTEAASAPPEAPQQLDSITAGVTDYSFTPFKKFIVFLDNGQVWRQLQGDAGIARFSRDPKDNTVTIERGLFGSYNLKIDDSHAVFKVTRVK
jgi:hypothetical protein